MSSANDCRLVALPAEVNGNVASHLPTSSYLSRLSQTCKQLRSTIQPLLYKDLTIYLRRDWSSVRLLEGLLDPDAHGLRYTIGISVLVMPDKCYDPFRELVRSDDLGYHFNINKQGDAYKNVKDAMGQKEYQPMLLNTLIRSIINRIPRQQIRKFHWHHPTKLSIFTLDLLAARHGTSVVDVRIHNADIDYTDIPPTFTNLRTLEIHDVVLTSKKCSFATLLLKNCASLRHLKIGCERTQAIYALNLEPPDDDDKYLTEYKENFVAEIEKLTKEWNDGFDPRIILGTRILPVVTLNNLQALFLESCEGMTSALGLATAATSSNARWIPRLRTFTVRHESPTPGFQKQLRSFLLSFSGLVNLSILLSGLGPALNPECFIKNHGASLKTLVLDQRSGPREHLDISTHIVPTCSDHHAIEYLTKISGHCPLLEELGIAFPTWADGKSYKYIGYLSQLKHLRSLNVRNLPRETRTFESLPAQQEIAPIIEKIAVSVVKQILDTRNKHPLGLDIIGFGSTTYADTWIGRTQPASSNIDYYLSPRIFHIERHINVKGEFQPLLTQIAQGTAAEAKEYSSHLQVFEPYWLNG